MASLAERIHDALPQTQCTRCGFQDCQAYAEAIALRGEPINQCPPGGQEGVERLAQITHQASLPLNAAFGLEAPRSVAVIGIVSLPRSNGPTSTLIRADRRAGSSGPGATLKRSPLIV